MSFLINPYIYDPQGGGGLPTDNLVAHYQPSGMSRHGLATVNGNAQIDTAQFKFGTSSLSLDGTGDSVETAGSADFRFTGDFTIQGWYNFTNLSGLVVSIWGIDNTELKVAWLDANSKWYLYTNTTETIGPSQSLSTGTWYHLALVRYGSTITFYQGGVSVMSVVDGTEINTAESAIAVGTYQAGTGLGQYVDGNVADFNVSHKAEYTGAFSVPTGPVGLDYTSKLYLKFEGTDTSTRILDSALPSSSRHGDATIEGDSQLDTAIVKYGSASLVVDGTGDRISYANDPDFDFGTADFTIQFWMYHSSHTNYGGIIGGDYLGGWNMIWNFSFNQPRFINNQNAGPGYIDYTSTTALANNTWTHVALVRNGTELAWYIAGVKDAAPITNSDSIDLSGLLYMGWQVNNGAPYSAFHMDDLRITHTAEYTATFTPPAQALGTDQFTKLYVPFDGADASTVIPDYALGPEAFALWADDSGLEHDSTGAVNPDGTPNSLDGHIGAAFNGSTQYMTIPDNSDMDQAGNISVIVVFKTTDTSGWLIGNAQASGFAGTFQGAINGPNAFFRRGKTSGGNAEWDVQGSVTINDDTYRAVSYIDNGTSMEILINNVTDVDATPGSYQTPEVSATGYNMGRRIVNNDGYLLGTIIELLMYNTDLDAPTRTQLNNYLTDKYPSL